MWKSEESNHGGHEPHVTQPIFEQEVEVEKHFMPVCPENLWILHKNYSFLLLYIIFFKYIKIFLFSYRIHHTEIITQLKSF